MNTLSSFFRSDKGKKRTPYKQRDDKISAKELGKSFLVGGGVGSTLVPMAQGLLSKNNPIQNSKTAGKLVLGTGLAGMGLYGAKKIYNKIQNRKKQYE